MNLHVAVHAKKNTFIQFGFGFVPRAGKATVGDAEVFLGWVNVMEREGAFGFFKVNKNYKEILVVFVE